MNLSQRLRTCAKHTGLDAVIELLTEAADEIDALQARARVQGDPSWWMRETYEGAEWTDTAPLVLSGWTPLYTTPQPAQAMQAEVTDAKILEVAEPFGAFQYGDAQGDKRIDFARAILALRPERVPMTDEALWTAVIEHLGPEALSGGRMSILDAFHLGITVAEAHHGIKPKEQTIDAAMLAAK